LIPIVHSTVDVFEAINKKPLYERIHTHTYHASKHLESWDLPEICGIVFAMYSGVSNYGIRQW
jgi:hypothetical protein